MRTILKDVRNRYLNMALLLATAMLLAGCGDDEEADSPPPVQQELPSVFTNPVAPQSGGSAIVGGNISDSGGSPVTRRGITWGFNANPNMGDNVVELGQGPGAFSTVLTELSGSTTYHIRAFAENSTGLAYGESRSFTTTGETGGMSTPGAGVAADGRFYPSVVINGVEWMAANLAVSIFSNGDTIPNIADNVQWLNAQGPAWSTYLNDGDLGAIYGNFYNRAAVVDPRGLCPTGWHVPTAAEMADLVSFLGGELSAGGKMKEPGIQYWLPPNTGASNTSGLNGRPQGRRSLFGGFNEIGTHGLWWSVTEASGGGLALFLVHDNAATEIAAQPASYGLGVRCVKDL